MASRSENPVDLAAQTQTGHRRQQNTPRENSAAHRETASQPRSTPATSRRGVPLARPTAAARATPPALKTPQSSPQQDIPPGGHISAPRSTDPDSDAAIAAVDRIRLLVAGISTLILVGLIYLASFDDTTAKPMALNGDVVGRDSGETMTAYLARTASQRAEHPCASICFAYVTFRDPVPTALASMVVSTTAVPRVNALVLDGAAPIPLPEPVAPENRAVVFDRAISTYARSRALPISDPALQIRALVVQADATQIQQLATQFPDVLAVEALPDDAVWGRFGVMPVVAGKDFPPAE
ncbi:hypothetical protein ACFPVT_07395 [Corynebacterium choanae]|nr:hypothetical protein [Corynebacterium choanae]